MAELNKVSVDDLKVTGKRVLVRVDFNVPMKDGVITNDNRIQAALPTINKLVSEGAKVILCSHLGKPKNGPEEKFSLKAAAARLAELVSAKVTFVPSDVVVDDTVRTAVDKMQNGEIVVLENTRFRKEETKNIDTFCKNELRAVKVKACQNVKKSDKLLQFTLDDGTGTDRQILSGIAKYYKPEELVGKTLVAITNLPPRKMMGRESAGMLLSAVHKENGEEKLNLVMLSDAIPAGAKLC